MTIGYAKLTTLTQQFLDTCPAVQSWNDLPGTDNVYFDFDESVEVHSVPPGVYFDSDSIPEEHADLREAITSLD